ncbi:MAG: gliding motility-associated ABC transporter ATP-binding subunit GldA [Saprospiraceae bacterium]
MSVIVQNLVKVYGAQRAVDAVSFEAKRGEVLGFLGPNGAGKTTTMKIITGYLPMSEGSVSVCGHDVSADSKAARARIGYLPEHNPLYRDMYVLEYLLFNAALHRVPNARARAEEMIERTGLISHRHKLIQSLSKGYRQRVGLAQAMLHDPEVLILDEPTSGLDPNQIIEIRNLIQSVGKERTVILSTHILGEVEAICDRAVIINQGRLVADAPIAALKEKFSGRNIVIVEFAQEVAAQALRDVEGVAAVEPDGPRRWKLASEAGKDIRAQVFAFAVERGLTLLELRRESQSVEEVFRALTLTPDPAKSA